MKDRSTHRPHILVLTSTFPRWKDDTEPAFVFELSQRLTANFDVTILAPRSPGSKDRETMDGLRIIRFGYFLRRWEKLAMHGGGIMSRLRSNPLNYFILPFFLVGQLWTLFHLLRYETFDLIHAHWLIPQGMIAALGLKLSRRRSIPLICTSHGGDLFALKGKLFEILRGWTINKSQMLTVVSRPMQRLITQSGIPMDKISVISMGADLRSAFVPDPDGVRNKDEILFVGRLVEVKGVDVLLNAMPEVLDKRPQARLTVAGAGPLERQLRDLSATLGIADRIDFVGMVEHRKLPTFYRRAALAVFPFVVTEGGVQEGFGLVMIEAMGCNCPVIAGDLPAIHESVSHEESGLLVAPGNPDALSSMILRALNDPDLCLRMTQKARNTAVENFDWKIIAAKYRNAYYKVLKSGHSN